MHTHVASYPQTNTYEKIGERASLVMTRCYGGKLKGESF